MERKTIGAFIAVLRKSSGLTQKQLAEMLGVSDKTVSHWERDESAPDISIIPVIAEIFDVTCDELLKGEKKQPSNASFSDENVNSQKRDKRLKFLLQKSLTKFKIQTLICCCISGVGSAFSIFAWWNFSWNCFFVELIFSIVSLCCLAVFYILLKQSVFADDFEDEAVKAALRSGKTMFLCCLVTIISIQCFTLPELLGQSLMPMGLLMTLSSLAFGFGVLRATGNISCPSKIKSLSKKQKKLWRLRIVSVLLSAFLCAAGLTAFSSLHTLIYSDSCNSRICFNTTEEFTAYMETEKQRPSSYANFSVTMMENCVFNEEGYIIIDEYYTDPCGEQIHVNFVWRNLEVSDYNIDTESEQTQIYVTTYEAQHSIKQKYKILNACHVVYYLLALLCVIWFYSSKSKKIKNS